MMVQSRCHRRRAASEVVCHPADRLDVGVFCLPLRVGGVVPSLHDVHAPAVVWLLVQYPAVLGSEKLNKTSNKTNAIFSDGGKVSLVCLRDGATSDI